MLPIDDLSAAISYKKWQRILAQLIEPPVYVSHDNPHDDLFVKDK
jgi:hypothetical protein